MEFVAQKLGFLRCQEQVNSSHNIGKRQIDISGNFQNEGLIKKKRKISQDDNSSESGSLSLGKMKITDSSDTDQNQTKQVTIPIPIRPIIQTKSMVIPPPDLSSLIGRFPLSLYDQPFQMPFNSDFPASEYLSFLVAPYGTPAKLIGPITQAQRKRKVDLYLQKKKNRQWKNVKYSVRKQLADNRKRVQGRFVKSERRWRWNQIPTNCQKKHMQKQQNQEMKQEENQQQINNV